MKVENNLATRELTNAAVAWEHKCAERANTAVKVKGDIKRNLSFSVKNSLGDYGNYIFGVNVQEFGGANRFSYGVQIDLSL
jgi:hypothetical protein